VGTTQLAGVVNWSSFANRFAVHGELAYRHLSEGSLDSAVDTWHRIFGLPDVVFNIAARRGF
jgi:hypothetical protein